MEAKNELISVIVPIYNIEQYLGSCIESLIKQTYKNLEIILVDDGSTDRCPALCDLYASKDGRIKVIHKPNGGLVSARKAGVKIAKGSYIGYVDGDDWIEDDYYDYLHRAIVKSKADIVCAGYSRDLFSKHVKCTNNILDGIYEGESLEKLYGQMLSYEDTFNVGITTYVWNKLFRAEIVKEVQMNVDERITIGEDAAVTYPALLRAHRVYLCDNSSYHYRQHEGSMLKIHHGFEIEKEKLRYLYDYLKGTFEESKQKNIMLGQLSDYITSYVIIRSGGVIDGECLFSEDIKGKKVAIIMAGTFGQVMYEKLSAYCDIVGWYDEDYWEYRRCGMNVDSIEKIDCCDFDYVIIAKTDNEYWTIIKIMLSKINIDTRKIVTLDKEKVIKKKMILEQ